MTRYIWKGDKFVERSTGTPMHKPFDGEICKPAVRSDLPAYVSPVTRQVIEGRAARREDLARTGCREVDPSEYRPQYQNRRFAMKHGKMDKYEGSE